MKSVHKVLMIVFVCLTLMMPAAYAADAKPGKGVKVQPARATWNTGFFQEALVRRGLVELGYNVKKPKDLQNPIFYKTVSLGDVDYWANGWFPNHDSQLPKDFYENADKHGFVVKAGGLQGYLVSKREVDKFGINLWMTSNGPRSSRPLIPTGTARLN
jgi:glycine betaine/proline transport system substrate-binding protein